MANRFWVGGTGTWDSTTTTQWSTTTGGAGGASAPGASDVAIFDGSSGGGTVTVDSTLNGTTLGSLTAGAFTGTLDFSVNNPSITMAAMSLTGSGSGRKFLMGTGTFTLTQNGSNVFDISTTTGLDGTSDFSGATFALNVTTSSQRTFAGGGRTFGTLSIASNTSRGPILIFGAATYTNWSIAAGTFMELTSGHTHTVTNAPTITGTSSLPTTIKSNAAGSATTISVASGTVACTWCAIQQITATGGATFSATDSFDLGRNTGITITAPSGGGGGGGQRVISG